MDDEFQGGGSGNATTFPQKISTLNKNDFIMLKGHPCKIVEMSKTNSRGRVKVNIA